MKEYIRNSLIKAGASAVGFADAGEIAIEAHEEYVKWINEGNLGEMSYLERHSTLRKHTDNVLKGSATVISLAFSYAPSEYLQSIASYAYGEDYHLVLKELLQPLVKDFITKFGGKWRICTDSIPLAERYWAMKCGIGRRGLNGSIIVDKCGSFCFLVEILTTLKIDADRDSSESCNKCGLCIKSCPGRALKGNGLIDARRCLNYLTIEKSSEFSDEEKVLVNHNKGHLYGCDICLRVCPHNSNVKSTHIPQFKISETIRNLNPEMILSLDKTEFNNMFYRSPLKYAGLDKLKRNSIAIKKRSGTKDSQSF